MDSELGQWRNQVVFHAQRKARAAWKQLDEQYAMEAQLARRHLYQNGRPNYDAIPNGGEVPVRRYPDGQHPSWSDRQAHPIPAYPPPGHGGSSARWAPEPLHQHRGNATANTFTDRAGAGGLSVNTSTPQPQYLPSHSSTPTSRGTAAGIPEQQQARRSVEAADDLESVASFIKDDDNDADSATFSPAVDRAAFLGAGGGGGRRGGYGRPRPASAGVTYADDAHDTQWTQSILVRLQREKAYAAGTIADLEKQLADAEKDIRRLDSALAENAGAAGPRNDDLESLREELLKAGARAEAAEATAASLQTELDETRKALAGERQRAEQAEWAVTEMQDHLSRMP